MASKYDMIDDLSDVETSCVDMVISLGYAGVGTSEWYTLPRSEQYNRLETLIGNTPVEDTGASINGDVLIKQEWHNPSGSHYDRAFVATLRSYEESGLIEPGDELRDITSGSGGISLALLSQALGYHAKITVPDELPDSRLAPMRFFGADVVNAGPGYMVTAAGFQANEIRELKDSPDWDLKRPEDRDQKAFVFTNGDRRICYLNHSENSLSVQAFSKIGREAVRQLTEPPEALVLAMGNWTTIAGISPVIREAWPNTVIVGYEGQRTDVHDNFGTSVDGIRLRFRDDKLVDWMKQVSDENRDEIDQRYNLWLPTQRKLGHSSMMGLYVAEQLAQHSGGKVLTIGYDQKIRY